MTRTRNPQKLQREVPWQQPLRQRTELSDRRLMDENIKIKRCFNDTPACDTHRLLQTSA